MISTIEAQYDMFEKIIHLDVGESLVFAPSAFVGMQDGEVMKLGAVALKMKTRARLGTDGGMSRLADEAADLHSETNWGNLHYPSHLDSATAPALPTGRCTLDDLFPELKD